MARQNKNLTVDPDLANTKSAACLLSISVATLRNWTQQGIISIYSKVGNRNYYRKSEILALKAKIEQRELKKLDQRRNKTARSEKIVPLENIQYGQTRHAIAFWLKHTQTGLRLELILFEAALQLLSSKGHLRHTSDTSKKSLTELALDGTLAVGRYLPLLSQMLDIKSEAISAHEGELLGKLREVPLLYHPDEDVLGLLYMSLLSLTERKGAGMYFTPSGLADRLTALALQSLNNKLFPTVLDPACGSGIFLVKIYRELGKQHTRADLNETTSRAILRKSIVGYDIDPVNVWLAKINLALESPPFSSAEDGEYAIYHADSLQLSSQPPVSTKAFDLVISNPPWGSLITLPNKELKQFRTFPTRETYSLFIELALKVLKNNGIIAFLVPDSWLATKKHFTTRELLLANASIKHMILTGNAFASTHAPCLLFVAEKAQTTPAQKISVELPKIPHPYAISQDRFLTNPEYRFNVHTPDEAHSITEKMRSLTGATTLAGQADFALGIVTGNDRLWLRPQSSAACEPIYKGQNIYKYNVAKPYLWIPTDSFQQFQQVAPLKIYRAPEKLIYRFINQQLVFAYDNQGTLTLNSANLLIPRIPELATKYLLAILNSRSAQFFYQSAVLTVKVLRSLLETIPVPVCGPSRQATIVCLVDDLLASDNSSQKLELYHHIEALVFDLYGLTEKERQYVLNETKPALRWILPDNG